MPKQHATHNTPHSCGVAVEDLTFKEVVIFHFLARGHEKRNGQ